MLEIVVRNILFLTNIKQTKETVKICLILALLLPKCTTEKFLNLCTKLACYNETVHQFLTNLLYILYRCRCIVR